MWLKKKNKKPKQWLEQCRNVLFSHIKTDQVNISGLAWYATSVRDSGTCLFIPLYIALLSSARWRDLKSKKKDGGWNQEVGNMHCSLKEVLESLYTLLLPAQWPELMNELLSAMHDCSRLENKLYSGQPCAQLRIIFWKKGRTAMGDNWQSVPLCIPFAIKYLCAVDSWTTQVWTVRVPFTWIFFNSKDYSTIRSAVGWLHRYRKSDMEECHIRRADYKWYTDFWLH